MADPRLGLGTAETDIDVALLCDLLYPVLPCHRFCGGLGQRGKFFGALKRCGQDVHAGAFGRDVSGKPAFESRRAARIGCGLSQFCLGGCQIFPGFCQLLADDGCAVRLLAHLECCIGVD